MARFHLEGDDADASDLASWTRIDDEFEANPSEYRAARMLYRFTGESPKLWDTNGRQKAVDILLTTPSGATTVVEVSSTYDPLLERDLSNTSLLETDLAQVYTGRDRWVLHFHEQWTVPVRRERPAFATTIAAELQQRDRAQDHGWLEAIPWIFAWRDDTAAAPGIEVRGWDSRVPPRAWRPASEDFAEFLDSPPMRKKRSKLVADGRALGASDRYLYLTVTPTGKNAHLAVASTWELSDGAFRLPDDLDELWLDSGGRMLRRFRSSLGYWVEYSI